jgi:hypothetical protein
MAYVSHPRRHHQPSLSLSPSMTPLPSLLPATLVIVTIALDALTIALFHAIALFAVVIALAALAITFCLRPS